ncbi:hypothetical protein [Salibacterium lacus]|uniref:DUF2829 domain-containing protein n=1 Tax=Salibacterium lacus TaxID=1898109 RepID=A0ABW5SWP3_9BACI
MIVTQSGLTGYEAIKAAVEEGKKIKQSYWNDGVYIAHEEEDSEIIAFSLSGRLMHSLKLDALNEKNWQVVEEEPSFQIDDWVVYDGSLQKYIGKVMNIEANFDVLTDYRSAGGAPQYFGYSELRHASEEEIEKEKERRKWRGVGREKDEYKVGDIVINLISGSVDEITSKYVSGGWGIRRTFGPMYNDSITLVTPVEHRFDKAGDSQ